MCNRSTIVPHFELERLIEVLFHHTEDALLVVKYLLSMGTLQIEVEETMCLARC